MNKKIILVSCALLTGLLAFGLFTHADKNYLTAKVPQSNEKVQMVSADRPIYNSIKELKKASQVVVLGTVKEQLETYNAAKDPNDPSKENPDFTVLTTDYRVEVKKYLAGQGENTILVAQEGGKLNNLKQSFEGRTPMEIGGTYIFFLSKDTTEKNRYKFGGDPYKFKVSDGKAEVDSTSEKVKEVFPVKSEKQFINEILNVN